YVRRVHHWRGRALRPPEGSVRAAQRRERRRVRHAQGEAPRAHGEALLASPARLHPVAPHGSRPEACLASRTRSAALSTSCSNDGSSLARATSASAICAVGAAVFDTI